jgi:nitrite reductase (NADH) small subunit
MIEADTRRSSPVARRSSPVTRHPSPVADDLGPVDAIPLGQGRAYVIGARTIAVFRQRDGRLFASDDACPHRGGPLSEGLLGAGTVICPLHGWKIELDSGRCRGESAAVRVYDVADANGRVILFLPEQAA